MPGNFELAQPLTLYAVELPAPQDKRFGRRVADRLGTLTLQARSGGAAKSQSQFSVLTPDIGVCITTDAPVINGGKIL